MKYATMQGGIAITNAVNYQNNVYTAFVGNKEITVRSLIPVFSSDEEKNRKKRDIESSLYRIFDRHCHLKT